MKRFHFPLRPVAMLRAHRELRAREVFAAALQNYSMAEEHLRCVGLRLRALEKALFNGREKTFHASEAAHLLSDYRRECEAETEAENRVALAREEVRKTRADYMAAHRELKIVGRLEEKARDHHRLENNRAEQAELDELAGSRRDHPLLISS
jgi:flagellar FliJ protein